MTTTTLVWPRARTTHNINIHDNHFTCLAKSKNKFKYFSLQSLISISSRKLKLQTLKEHDHRDFWVKSKQDIVKSTIMTVIIINSV